MRRYTILHAIETGGPGGAETVLLELAANLDSSRYRSVAFVSEGSWLPKQLKERGVPTVIADSKAWYDLGLPRAMMKLVRKENVDLIHSHLPDQNFYSCLVGRLVARKVVVTFHGAPELARYRGPIGAIKRRLVRSTAAAGVVVSEYLRKHLQDSGFPADKIIRIYNGINADRFEGAQPGKLRRELNLPASARLVGMVANLRQSKGYEYFVQAARLVVNSFPEARFVSVGEKEEHMAAGLADMVRQLDLDDRFTFLGFRSDVPEVLADLDVFVLSSVSEGLSIATLEAMAAGRPVVVTQSGGPEELVADGRTGRLVPPADPAALAAGICELLKNPGLAMLLGRNAQEESREKFSVSRMIAEYESLYQRCLGPAT